MRHPSIAGVTAGCLVLSLSCSAPQESPGSAPTMDGLAEQYVKLVLAVGQHDPDYVDAYYGPEAWREEASRQERTLEELSATAERLVAEAASSTPSSSTEEELLQLRRRYLRTQLQSVVARIALLAGESMTFDEEAKALYDAEPPTYSDAYFQGRLDRLEELLPGDGPLVERYAAFKQDFIIPKDRLDAVFQAAIEECRLRTSRYLELPENEDFTVEYVTDKAWSGYNWYQGDSRSLIQVNTDLPIYIDRAIDLACHEGYPGHHVYNALLEHHLVRERGWVEFSVYPLFSPQSLIAEGTANYGIDVAFPGDSRIRFESDVLFPLAGLDPNQAQAYYDVQREFAALSYAGNEAARRYLNGEIDAAAAAEHLMSYALMPRARAEQRVRFIDQYRSYVINYNFGQDLARQWVEAQAGGQQPEHIWAAFQKLLSSPRLPGDLQQGL